jgi:hypothetical protein
VSAASNALLWKLRRHLIEPKAGVSLRPVQQDIAIATDISVMKPVSSTHVSVSSLCHCP